MKTVYLVLAHFYGETEVVGVYSTAAAAEVGAAERRALRRGEEVVVTEAPLDAPVPRD